MIGYTKLTIPVIAGILVIGIVGLYPYSDAEVEPDFVCNPTGQNGYVLCSNPPAAGDQGLLILDSHNSCPIDVSFTLENRFVVKFQDHPDCIYNDGFTLVLTID